MVSKCACRGHRPTRKCQCGDIVVVFEPHVVVSNSQHQKTWYKNYKEKCAEYNI